ILLAPRFRGNISSNEHDISRITLCLYRATRQRFQRLTRCRVSARNAGAGTSAALAVPAPGELSFGLPDPDNKGRPADSEFLECGVVPDRAGYSAEKARLQLRHHEYVLRDVVLATDVEPR